MSECDAYSNDVKLWAEYRTGVKEFTPWLTKAEAEAAAGLSKPSDLEQVQGSKIFWGKTFQTHTLSLHKFVLAFIVHKNDLGQNS